MPTNVSLCPRCRVISSITRHTLDVQIRIEIVEDRIIQPAQPKQWTRILPVLSSSDGPTRDNTHLQLLAQSLSQQLSPIHGPNYFTLSLLFLSPSCLANLITTTTTTTTTAFARPALSFPVSISSIPSVTTRAGLLRKGTSLMGNRSPYQSSHDIHKGSRW